MRTARWIALIPAVAAGLCAQEQAQQDVFFTRAVPLATGPVGMAAAGIEVLTCKSRGRSLSQNKSANALADHELALALGREALTEAPDAQALLMPGGLWFAIHAVPLLEQEFGKPVLLNILSTTCSALRSTAQRTATGVARADPRWGMVLASAYQLV